MSRPRRAARRIALPALGLAFAVVVLALVAVLLNVHHSNPPASTPSQAPGYYERLPAAPTVCPSTIDPALEPFYRQCFPRKGSK